MKKDIRLIFSIINRYFRQYRKQVVFVLLLMLLSSAVSLIVPYTTKYYMDKALPSNTISMVIWVLVAYLLLSALVRLIPIWYGRILWRLNFIVVMKMRTDVVSRIHRMPWLKFQQYTEEYLFNRTIQDTLFIHESFITTAIRMIQNITLIIFGTVCILVLNVYLSLVVLAIIGLNIFISQYFGRILARLQEPIIETYTHHQSTIQSTIKHTFMVKIFNLYRWINQAIVSSFRKYYRLGRKSLDWNYASYFTNSGLQTLCRTLIMLIGGIWIIQGKFTIGSLFAFLAYYEILNAPALELVESIISFKKNLPVYGRINEMLNAPTEYALEPRESISFERCVALSDVSFAYSEDSVILDEASADFEVGKISLLSGSSGSGKTTIASLLLGINRPQSGKITFDGIEMEDSKIESIRAQSAYVEQEPVMMHNTIYNNILLGNRKASEEEVMQAAKSAYVDEFVDKLTDGYQTKLGGDGITLSTGQKQRIALARCILRNPKLLILDEPVSNVDPHSEQLIYQTVKTLAPDRIVVIISHKQETRAIADVVYQIKDAKLNLLNE